MTKIRLFIAEKPELGRAIASTLGNGKVQDGYIECSSGNDIVTWCYGHMLELSDPEDYDIRYKKWNLSDLPIKMIPWKLKKIAKSKSQLENIANLLKKADTIVHAGDPDEEGQLLVDEILEYYSNKKPVKRILINNNSNKVISKALANMRDNSEFVGLYNSALARSVADQHYGYNMTRAYTISAQKSGFDGVLSVGRVQTPILGLVVSRCQQNRDHKSHSYQVIIGNFDFGKDILSARYISQSNDPVDDKGRIIDQEFAQKIAKDCKGDSAFIKSVKTEDKEAPPPLPYNLLNLQVDANKKYGIKPDAVLEITQELREKYSLITYNRSDCQYLMEEDHKEAPNIIAAINNNLADLSDFSKESDSTIKSRAFNSSNCSAHHAIIPTEEKIDISRLNSNQKKIYYLISRAYLAQFFPKQKYRTVEIIIQCHSHQFKINSKTVLISGWLSLYKNDEDTNVDEGVIENDLSIYKENHNGTCIDTNVESKKTNPPPLYKLDTLLKDLTRVSKYIKDPKIKKLLLEKDKEKKGEQGGIGTPATRSSIIKLLFDRKFLEEKGKNVVSTKLGEEFYNILPQNAKTPDMTALWHQQQKEIQSGKKTVESFLDELIKYITDEVEISRTRKMDIKVEGAVKCPNCEDGQLNQRKGKNGVFWGCSSYPECKTTFPDLKGKPNINAKKQEPVNISKDNICPDCNSGLVRRPSKKNKKIFWWGCSGFPKCKNIYFESNGKPIINKKEMI